MQKSRQLNDHSGETPVPSLTQATAASQGLSRREEAGALLAQAKLALEVGLLRDSNELIRKALVIQPDHLEARLLRARISLLTDRQRPTFWANSGASGQDWEKQQLLREIQSRARSLCESHQHPLAVAMLERACQIDPRQRQLRQLAAVICMIDGQRGKAMGHLAVLLELDPANKSARRIYARMLALRDPLAAVDLILAEPQHAQAPELQFWAARLLAQQGYHERARNLLTRLERQPLTKPAAVVKPRAAKPTTRIVAKAIAKPAAKTSVKSVAKSKGRKTTKPKHATASRRSD
ncbi:MAG: hypothetical protein IT442_11120 [Phycisphaeraceae bacterium]|nr:hypothetical protein [Phycisphaeraceae bacterium]